MFGLNDMWLRFPYLPYFFNPTLNIVAKFNFFQDKDLIKYKAAEKLQTFELGVWDKFPKEIPRKDRASIPVIENTSYENGGKKWSYRNFIV